MFYFGYGIAFYGAGWWTSRIDFDGNVVIFGVHNSSSSHSENHNFGNFGSSEKKNSIKFSKTNTKLCLSLHYNHDNIY